jgi:Holliday junction resolvase RusA-like endonuclease
VEARPSFSGKGKEAYYRAVKTAALEEIRSPITTSDIEIEIIYSTSTKAAERLDTDNVNKPTLDALKGVAYIDDGQVRHVESTLFDKARVGQVNGRVEHIGRLFYSQHPHVVLIRIYSDSRLAELGGEAEVQRHRYESFVRDFDAQMSAARTGEDEFVPSAGVYREKSSGHHVCPRCRSNNKRALLVVGTGGFSCPVCTGYFPDRARAEETRPRPQPPRGPLGWMA